MIFELEHQVAVKAAGLTIGSYRTDSDHFVGVLRRGRTIVLECGHTHINRDVTSHSSGTSATDCVRLLVRAARRPELYVENETTRIATAWQHLGSYATASTIERAKAQAPADVEAYRVRLARVAALLAG